MDQLIFNAPDEAATERLARALAEVLPPSAVVALNGPLGAGKTRFVQGLAAAAGVLPGMVTSPTFVLVQEYAGRQPIYHFDLYRLRDEDEFLELAPDEYFGRGGWSLVEWGERFERLLPDERLDITIEPTGPTSRKFILAPHGRAYKASLEALAALE
ncbi:MAG TPA: tRNA (adenosine(37)-N6)-threonylcarbamoyltransferase complex ATPase subunit type 1 TsaE [Pirellulales bacterium]|nr:tRNA (adenosine(37)-N6)-threonylcarbamoyltransferase complex ATPase subunit type 1 TsaE [Pirellulales bacterium]